MGGGFAESRAGVPQQWSTSGDQQQPSTFEAQRTRECLAEPQHELMPTMRLTGIRWDGLRDSVSRGVKAGFRPKDRRPLYGAHAPQYPVIYRAALPLCALNRLICDIITTLHNGTINATAENGTVVIWMSTVYLPSHPSTILSSLLFPSRSFYSSSFAVAISFVTVHRLLSI